MVSAGVMKKLFWGRVARGLGSVMVKRFFERAKYGSGTISFTVSDDVCYITGRGTRFHEETQVGDQITSVIARRHHVRGRITEICGRDRVVLSEVSYNQAEFCLASDPEARKSLRYCIGQGSNSPQLWTTIIKALTTNKGVCIFPEGANHDQPQLLPLRSKCLT
jgi:hypothetical protein